MILWMRALALVVLLAIPTAGAVSWVSSAKSRLAEKKQAADGTGGSVAVAAAADEGYCSASLKKVLRRVLYSCGLLGGDEDGARGCQPVDAKSVATMSGDDFNALFTPMKERGGIVQFDSAKADLEDADTALVDKVFSDQRGASYFFVVARASPDGSTAFNRDLSKQRAEVIMSHLRTKFDDPDLDKEVGLLWLGEEFAQLDEQFCQWQRSSAGECKTDALNRSAFIAWIDCRL